jgi:hypothetical protein
MGPTSLTAGAVLATGTALAAVHPGDRPIVAIAAIAAWSWAAVRALDGRRGAAARVGRAAGITVGAASTSFAALVVAVAVMGKLDDVAS